MGTSKIFPRWTIISPPITRYYIFVGSWDRDLLFYPYRLSSIICWRHQFHSCHKGRGNGMLFHTTPGQILVMDLTDLWEKELVAEKLLILCCCVLTKKSIVILCVLQKQIQNLILYVRCVLNLRAVNYQLQQNNISCLN